MSTQRSIPAHPRLVHSTARWLAIAMSSIAIAACTGPSERGFDHVMARHSGIKVTAKKGYKIWTVTGFEVYDLKNGETLSNILVDQSASHATLTIRARDKTNWIVRNVGFKGVGQYGSSGSSHFQFQVSAPAGGKGLIENIWMSGKARDGQAATKLGGIYIRASHAGHIDIRHTYIEGFGNNAVYGSAVGKDSGKEGSITIEDSYHRDNTVSQFRIGSPNSIVRHSVGVVDDPKGKRGSYPYFSSKNARGIWGKHFPKQRVENSSFYISPKDIDPDGVFEARYIANRSRGSKAVLEVVNCNVNKSAPQLTGTTANATVKFTNLGHNPTVTVIRGGGVPLSPQMAALGQRKMPPENPGATPLVSARDGGGSSTGDGGQTAGDQSSSAASDGGGAATADSSMDGGTGGGTSGHPSSGDGAAAAAGGSTDPRTAKGSGCQLSADPLAAPPWPLLLLCLGLIVSDARRRRSR